MLLEESGAQINCLLEIEMKKSVLVFAALMAVSSAVFAKVDINKATETELAAIKGMDTVKAKSIVEYRQKHGAFRSVKELEKVPGFSPNTVAKLSPELGIGEGTMSATTGNKAAPKQK